MRGLMSEQQTTPAGEDESNVSPEEQQQYNEYVENGMNMMYDEKIMPQLMETVTGSGNPIEGLANAIMAIVTRLDDSAEKKGVTIPGDVKLHGATEIMEQMVELAETAGVHEYTEEEMESAYYRAIDLYRESRQEQGKLPVEDLKQDMGELVEADKQGRLEDMMPGIGQFAQRGNPRKDQDQQAAGIINGAPQQG